MNLNDVLYMKNTGKVKEGAELFDILLAKKLSGGGVVTTITGNPLAFVTRKAQKAISTKITMFPMQDLHGYDNPWPDGGNVNLFNKDTGTFGKWMSVTGEISDASYGYISEKINTSGNRYFGMKHYGVKPYSMGIAEYDENDNFIARQLLTHSMIETQDYFNVYLNANTTYIVFLTANGISGTDVITQDILDSFKIVLYVGSTSPTSYTPYSNICPITGRTSVKLDIKDSEQVTQDEITISFDQTVYGGTLDLETGVLTVDKVCVTYNGSENWVDNGASNGGVALSVAQLYNDVKYANKYTCLPPGAGSSMQNLQCRLNSNKYNFLVKDQRITSVEEFKTLLNSEALQVCFELATPTTIQLTPSEVQLLKGANTVWTDGDTIELTYKA